MSKAPVLARRVLRRRVVLFSACRIALPCSSPRSFCDRARTSCSLWKSHWLLDVDGGGARGVVIVDLAVGAAVLAVVLMVGWLALSNIFGRYK
jgi:hypothetical protein